MQSPRLSSGRSARRATLLLTAALAGVLLPGLAWAQVVVAKVNGQIISSYDIDQRIRIEKTFSNKTISRPQALEQIIDDKLKIQEGKRVGFRFTEDELDTQVSRVASNYRQTRQQFEENIRARGIEMTVLREKILAESMWSSLIPYKARSIAPTNEEINAAIQERVKQGKARITDYTLNQVIFVVPGASAGVAAQRQKEAAGLRGRFAGCESGLEMLRGLRDVAVRPTVYRSSSDLPPQMNDLLQKTPVGQLSQPYQSEQGIEMLAVCDKKERTDESVVRNEVENELRKKMSENLSDRILKDIRSKAVIER